MIKADMAAVKAYLGRYTDICFLIRMNTDLIRMNQDEVRGLDNSFIVSDKTRECHEKLLRHCEELNQQHRKKIVEYEKERDKLVAAVDAVEDPEGREAVRLHYFQGMAFSEIAEKLCLSERQLYRRLNDKVYPEILRNI